MKQSADISQTDALHVIAPAGFPIPDDCGVRADQICQLHAAVMVPSAEESKVLPKLTVVQYYDHSITSLVVVYLTYTYLSI